MFMKRLLSMLLVYIMMISCFTVSALAPPVPEEQALEAAKERMNKDYIQSHLPDDTNITEEDLNHISCKAIPTIHLDSKIPSVKQAYKNPTGYLFIVYANQKPAITIWTIQNPETNTFHAATVHGDADYFTKQQVIFEQACDEANVVASWHLAHFLYGTKNGKAVLFPASERDNIEHIPNAKAYMKSQGQTELFILKQDFQNAIRFAKDDDHMGGSILYHLTDKASLPLPWRLNWSIVFLLLGITIVFIALYCKRKFQSKQRNSTSGI